MSGAEIDQYLQGLDEPRRATLQQLRRSILRAAPHAEEGLAYGVPAFRVDGTVVAGFSAAKHHLSYLPHSGTVLATLEAADLEGLSASKGALRFPVDSPLEGALVARLVTARLCEIAG